MLLVSALLSIVLAGSVATVDPTVCACALALERGGWCAMHQVGYLGEVEIASARIFDLLDAHGHDVDPTSFHCEACQRAVASDGFCAEHRVGFLDGRAYFSRLSHVLAKGLALPPAAKACPVCSQNNEHHVFCETCGRGRIGSVPVLDRADFDAALEAIERVRQALEVAKRCEDCSLALLTDTECPFCRIRYKAGQPVPRPD